MRSLVALVVAAVVLVVSAACTSFGIGSVPVTPDADGGDGADAAPPLLLDGGKSGCESRSGSALFCDDFDDRTDPSDVVGQKWAHAGDTGKGAATIDSNFSFSGARSLSLSYQSGTTNTGVGIHKKVSVSGSGVAVRAVVQTAQIIEYVQLYSFVADGLFFAVVIDNGKVVAQYADHGDVKYVPTGTAFPRGSWVEIELDIRFGNAGHAGVSLNGKSIFAKDASTTPGLSVDDFDLLITPNFADKATAEAVTIHYDDVSVEPPK